MNCMECLKEDCGEILIEYGAYINILLIILRIDIKSTQLFEKGSFIT